MNIKDISNTALESFQKENQLSLEEAIKHVE
jgi:hypothetical protein